MKVQSHTETREHILNHKKWYLGERQEVFELDSGRLQGGRIVAILKGLDDRDEASRHVGKAVCVPVSALPALADGDYYWRELEGLQAIDSSGVSLGVVDHLFETGANDVLVIRCGDREILAPYVPSVVRKVDLDSGFIELDWEDV